MTLQESLDIRAKRALDFVREHASTEVLEKFVTFMETQAVEIIDRKKVDSAVQYPEWWIP